MCKVKKKDLAIIENYEFYDKEINDYAKYEEYILLYFVQLFL